MSVHTEPVEWTVLDILRMHREWITILFINQRKTEVEIVELLYERNIYVSLHQLHRLLQQWRLVPSPSSTRTTTSARPSSGLDGRAATTSSEPESRNAYERRPLPSLPRTGSSRRARESNRAPNRPPQTQSGVNQHQHRHRRVEREVGSVSAHEGSSSPLENYVMDPQTHEMIAIGLV